MRFHLSDFHTFTSKNVCFKSAFLFSDPHTPRLVCPVWCVRYHTQKHNKCYTHRRPFGAEVKPSCLIIKDRFDSLTTEIPHNSL